MKLTVKTLKGGKFQVDAEPSKTVAEVKAIIEAAKSELPAANMKLIHSGKVLKDDDTIEACNIKPNDFLVVMVTKAKKATPKPVAAAAPAPAAAEKKEEKKEEPKTPAAAPAPAAASSTTESSATESAAATDTTTTPAPSSAPSAAPPAPSRPADDSVSEEAVTNLTAMGFPEAEVRACLRASGGNPDVAVEFLTNGIPPGIQEAQQTAAPTPASGGSSSSSGGSGRPLEALRAHPQLNQLRTLVQSNPQMLQQVLTQIGQQNPELLQEINANQAAFLEMMNEPVSEDAPAPAPSAGASAPSGGSSSGSGSGGGAGGMAGMLPGMENPAQMAQMLQNMSPQELQSMAAVMGLTPEQLQTMAQMIGQMPPEQFREYMNMAMQGGGGGGAAAMMGGMGGLGGPQVLRLNEEEMAAVDRLADMGFDRAEAAQAYLACDKNEALAANLLMDGGFADDGGNAPGGGGGSGSGGGGSGGGSSGGSGSGGGNDDDDMYD